MDKKKSIVVLCGGVSTEHEISIQSAMNVVQALDKNKYDIGLIYITPQGEWLFTRELEKCLTEGVTAMVHTKAMASVSMELGAAMPTFLVKGENTRHVAECIFPVLHGTHGEDGCVQGLLTLAKSTFVGDNVLSSAMCMDKDITKQLLRANGIPTTPWVCVTEPQMTDGFYEQLTHTIGEVLFVKPNSLGSSVGVNKVQSKAEFDQAIQEGFKFDERLIIEPCIVGREIECAVLGNDDPVASIPAEIITSNEFYTYRAKYLDANAARTEVPARIPAEVVEKVQKISVDAFKVLRCSGMLRVDFFLNDNKTLLVNEVNTIPGFTNISMYPQMWQASGISYSELLDQLITLAIARQQKLDQLNRVYLPQAEKTQINVSDKERH